MRASTDKRRPRSVRSATRSRLAPPRRRNARSSRAASCVVVPLDAAAHGDDLYAGSHGRGQRARLDYLFDAALRAIARASGPHLEPRRPRTIRCSSHRRQGVGPRASATPTLMRIEPAHRVIEVGNILYHAGAAAHARRHGGHVPDGRLRLRRPRLPALRVEVQRPQRALASAPPCASASPSRASSATT